MPWKRLYSISVCFCCCTGNVFVFEKACSVMTKAVEFELQEGADIKAMRAKPSEANFALRMVRCALKEITARVDNVERAIYWIPVTRFNLSRDHVSAGMSVPTPYTPIPPSPPTSPAFNESDGAQTSSNVCEPVCIGSEPVIFLGPSPEDAGDTLLFLYAMVR